jgi:hypothetical protein
VSNATKQSVRERVRSHSVHRTLTTMPRQPLLLSALMPLLLPAGADGQWHGVDYDVVSVWPQPRQVTLPTAGGGVPAGPHALTAAMKVSVASTCMSTVFDLATEAVGLPATHFRAPVRTYAEAAYASLDDATCGAQRCVTNADCNANSAASVCYIRSDLRWSSTTPCSPSSSTGLNAACGCCVASVPLPAIPTLSVDCGAEVSTSGLRREGKDGAGVGAAADTDSEAYELSVTATGISVSAGSSRGAAAGLATLAQTLRYDSDLAVLVADVVPLVIADVPSFPWRGFMIDTSRHFVPLQDLLATVDAMAAAHFNVFHWHVVDSPSFPLDSAAYPELAREGSWSRSNATIYSQADVASVAERCNSRFVQLVMEVDTPAHTLAIGRSHPEMMTGQGCWEWMANSGFKVDVDSDDCMALDPTSSAAREMVRNLISEVATVAGPEAKFFHIGGDEVK